MNLSIQNLDETTRIVFIERNLKTKSRCFESSQLTLDEASTFIKERIRSNRDPKTYWSLEVITI